MNKRIVTRCELATLERAPWQCETEHGTRRSLPVFLSERYIISCVYTLPVCSTVRSGY